MGRVSYDYPAVKSRHIAEAKLYADRTDMIRSLKQSGVNRVMEVGVALGHFSRFLIEEFVPDEFVAVDLFGLDQIPMIWGKPTSEIFGKLSHEEYYKRQLPSGSTKYIVQKGMSESILRSHLQAGSKFDFIYIDADHSYEGVKLDTDLCKHLLNDNRLMIFNDYTMGDPITKDYGYGVVRCVNELLEEGGWEVVGFSLQQHMFCDIALRKIGSSV